MSAPIEISNFIGRKFNNLTILSSGDVNYRKNRMRFCLCKCVCGKEKFLSISLVMGGHVKSCGCRGEMNKIGQKFNYLTVIEKKLSNNGPKWLCRCDCGKEVLTTYSNLKFGCISSCGCKRIKGCQVYNWNGYGEFSGKFFSGIKSRSRICGHEFNLTKEYIWDLFLKQNRKCALSGLLLLFNSQHGKIDGNASLDRIDSSKGYIEGNVQWIHKHINKMKMEFEQKYFIEMCRKITEHNSMI